MVFAAERHRTGRRRVAHPEAEPELNHLIRTTWWTHSLGLSLPSGALPAAMLHDVLERSEVTPAELSIFAPDVRGLVHALTDGAYAHEHERQVAQRFAARELSPPAALIRAMSKLDNLVDHGRRREATMDPYAAWAFPVFETAWDASEGARGTRQSASELYEAAMALAPDETGVACPPGLIGIGRPVEDSLGCVLDAAHFAAEHHRAQRRKSRADDEAHQIPYINHPIRVAALLVHDGGVTDPVAIQAALLHDTIEDTIAKPHQLERRFGEAVMATVMAVTDDKSLPKAERKRLQIDHAPHMSPAAALVKLADKIDNLRDLGVAPPDWPLERIRGYFDWAEAVVSSLPTVSPVLLRAFEESMRARP